MERALQRILSPGEDSSLSLSEAIACLDQMARSGEIADRHLLHYLQNRSYRKALDHIQDPATPHQP